MVMFHTQEKREQRLKFPVPTTRSDAWLGNGCYFWYYQDDATFWGRTSKTKTGSYEVYNADIKTSEILDTVFNEEHYLFWVNNIEKAIHKFVKGNKGIISLKYINDFFKDRGLLDGIDGVLFQDISNNPDYWIVKKFQYKKRIQLAVYNTEIISNFTFDFEAEC